MKLKDTNLVFLDTEFSDLPRDDESLFEWRSRVALLSVGLVPLSGTPPFYGRLSDQVLLDWAHRKNTSNFVRANVLPHIKMPNEYITDNQHKLRQSALQFLNTLQGTSQAPLVIMATYAGDFHLLWDQFPKNSKKIIAHPGNFDGSLYEDFFVKAQLPQHNALADAFAMRYAFVSPDEDVLINN